MAEGNRGHLDRKKFPDWAKRKDVGIAADEENGAVERRDHSKNMPTVGEEFGFLITPRWYQDENHREEGYQWVICIMDLPNPMRNDFSYVRVALVGFGMKGFLFWVETEYTQWKTDERVVLPQNFLLAWGGLRLFRVVAWCVSLEWIGRIAESGQMLEN